MHIETHLAGKKKKKKNAPLVQLTPIFLYDDSFYVQSV